MKAHGMTNEQVKEALPAKRRAQGSVIDSVVKKMFASEETPKERGRKSNKA